MKISRKKINKKWFKHDSGAEFEVRPFPFSLFSSDVNVETRRLETTTLKDQFMYCLCDWKGLKEDDDKEFKHNDENKQFLYDYHEEIRGFVFEKANLTAQEEDRELKN